MKLVKYNEGRLGALVDDSVIDLNYAFAAYKKSNGAANPQRKADAKVPSCLLAFIKEGDNGLEKAKKALEHVKAGACCGPKGEKLVYKKGEYKLRAPLPSKATKIAMAGANFYDHSIDAYKMMRGDTTTLEELKAKVEAGEYRTWGFWKQSSFVRDPDGETPYPSSTKRMDYEVELAMVLLDDLDLNAPPASYADFINGVAFFTANDVSDREPIILDSVYGYTRGKSHPGYLPTGPWMIHGRHLQPRTATEGNQILDLTLTVEEAAQGGRPARTRRLQSSDTGRMILGPWQIIRLLVSRHQQGLRTCMRDADGIPRYTQTPAGIIPAGSLILTGTPGGTAIQAPGLLGKLDLFVRGGFSPTGARQQMIEDSEGDIQGSRYLEPGDLVETAISSLGQQQWRISKQTSLSPYGIDAPGDCHSPLHTSGHSEQK